MNELRQEETSYNDDDVEIVDLDAPEQRQVFMRRRKRLLTRLFLLAALALSGVAFLGLRAFFDHPSPGVTLTSFCQEMTASDFHAAYRQFSSVVELWPDEAAFASLLRRNFALQGGLKNCSVANISTSGTYATGKMLLTFGNGITYPLTCNLTSEQGAWKITNLYSS
jgi:hypothetical protein